MKLEQTGHSETLAYKIQTPGNYPEESIAYVTYLYDLPLRHIRLSIQTVFLSSD